MSNLYEVQDLNISDLVAPKWAAVYTLRPEKIQIRSSIQKHGILAPVVVQQDTGVIIDGKTRVETAYELGWRQVPASPSAFNLAASGRARKRNFPTFSAR